MRASSRVWPTRRRSSTVLWSACSVSSTAGSTLRMLVASGGCNVTLTSRASTRARTRRPTGDDVPPTHSAPPSKTTRDRP